mmetsp:Transcript_9110/g.21563  ORF Transcript_9110/g.21563 Transcript_9110/m.21563 type:complete len:212 (-) Transcript_9110:502-1137(-)
MTTAPTQVGRRSLWRINKADSKLGTEALAALAGIRGAALPTLHAGPNLNAGKRGTASSTDDIMPPEFAEVTDDALAELVQKWKQTKADCADGVEPPLPPLNQCQRKFCRRLMPWLFDARRTRVSGEPRAEWGQPRLPGSAPSSTPAICVSASSMPPLQFVTRSVSWIEGRWGLVVASSAVDFHLSTCFLASFRIDSAVFSATLSWVMYFTK